MSETFLSISNKRQKFRSFAENRTSKALEAIGRIGNLSNSSSYEWEQSEVRRMVKALKDAVSAVEARFEAPKGRGEAKFKF